MIYNRYWRVVNNESNYIQIAKDLLSGNSVLVSWYGQKSNEREIYFSFRKLIKYGYESNKCFAGDLVVGVSDANILTLSIYKNYTLGTFCRLFNLGERNSDLYEFVKAVMKELKKMEEEENG